MLDAVERHDANAFEPGAVPHLLRRLASDAVQHDAKAEEAVCRALVACGVMRSTSDGRYGFVPKHEMDRAAVDALDALDAATPLRYFLVREARR